MQQKPNLLSPGHKEHVSNNSQCLLFGPFQYQHFSTHPPSPCLSSSKKPSSTETSKVLPSVEISKVPSSDSVWWNHRFRGGPPSPERESSSNRANLVICNNNFFLNHQSRPKNWYDLIVVNNEHAPEITFVCYVWTFIQEISIHSHTL